MAKKRKVKPSRAAKKGRRRRFDVGKAAARLETRMEMLRQELNVIKKSLKLKKSRKKRR